MALRYRSTEKEICEYLLSQGFDESRTTVRDVELIGIERPGWIQVFTFTVSARDDDQRETWFGVLRDDQRAASDFFLLSTETEQRQVIERLTDGLTTHDRRPASSGVRFVSIVVGVLIAGLALLPVIRDVPGTRSSSADAGSHGRRNNTRKLLESNQTPANARAQTKLERLGE
jgi:hypothetical protein